MPDGTETTGACSGASRREPVHDVQRELSVVAAGVIHPHERAVALPLSAQHSGFAEYDEPPAFNLESDALHLPFAGFGSPYAMLTLTSPPFLSTVGVAGGRSSASSDSAMNGTEPRGPRIDWPVKVRTRAMRSLGPPPETIGWSVRSPFSRVKSKWLSPRLGSECFWSWTIPSPIDTPKRPASGRDR